MTLGRYVVGLAYLALIVGPLAVGAWHVRARVLAHWTGALARLAEVILAIAALCTVGQLLGAVGLFRVWAVVPACVLVGCAAIVVVRRMGPLPERPPKTEGRRVPFLEGAAATSVVALLGAQWVTWISQAFIYGISNSDSLWYHLPIAVRFVQTGWVTHAHFLNGESLVSYYPANVPLLHAIGMLAFGRDFLSILVASCVAAIALLAGWCIGQRWQQGPAGLIGVALPLLLTCSVEGTSATAKDDIFAMALLLATVAFVLHSDRRRAPIAMSGISAGLALSTKLTMVAPMFAVAVGITVVAVRGTRWLMLRTWAIPVVLTGSFWYIRNIVVLGSPLPATGGFLDVLPFPKSQVGSYTRFGSSLFGFLFNWHAWDAVLIPGYALGLGRAGPVLLIAAAVGAISVIFRGRGYERISGAVAVVAALAYVVTPGSAYALNVIDRPGAQRTGMITLFAYNFRYAMPALALALALLACVRFRGWPRTNVPLLVFLVACAVLSQFGSSAARTWWPGHTFASVMVATIVAAIYLALWLSKTGRRARRITMALAALAIAAVPIAGWPIVEDYFTTRYSQVESTQFVSHLHHTRIAVAGFVLQYPYAGADLSNYVQYMGRRGPNGSFHPYYRCIEYRRALRTGRFRFVAVPTAGLTTSLGYDLARWDIDLPSGEPPRRPAETAWTRTDPGATPVLLGNVVSIYRLDNTVSAKGCSPKNAPRR